MPHMNGFKINRNQTAMSAKPTDLQIRFHVCEAGWIHMDVTHVIDEIPGAYKDIDQVMANQADLTEILRTLKQVVCVKG